MSTGASQFETTQDGTQESDNNDCRAIIARALFPYVYAN